MSMLTQPITLSILFLIAFFQVRNFIKYRKSGDKANPIRAILILTNTCFIGHTLRLMYNYSYGYFFTIGVCFILVMYLKGWVKNI